MEYFLTVLNKTDLQIHDWIHEASASEDEESNETITAVLEFNKLTDDVIQGLKQVGELTIINKNTGAKAFLEFDNVQTAKKIRG